MSLSSLNPFKKEVVLMSPLKGALLKGGVPLANVDIEVVIVMPGGEERKYQHKTNSDGEFDLPVIKDKMTLGPMTEFAVSQFVFVDVDGEKQRVWYAGKREPNLFAEFIPHAEAIGLTCEVSDENIVIRQARDGIINTRCKWTKLRKI